MIDLSNYLEKFRVLLKGEGLGKKGFQEVIKDVCGIEIPKERIQIKEGKVFLDVSPIVRSEIFLKKEKILEILKERSLKITEVR